MEDIVCKKPKLREGVDVYVDSINNIIYFVYLSTRKRLKVKAIPSLISSLSFFSGEYSARKIGQMCHCDYQLLSDFIKYLFKKGILIKSDWIDSIDLPVEYKIRMSKQLEFLLDIVGTTKGVEKIQKEIYNTHVAIFGVGGVGSWISKELVMLGFTKFMLFDYTELQESSISRHEFFSTKNIGRKKTELAKKSILEIDNQAKIRTHNIALKIETDIVEILHDVDLIINCADEPYIGYTSLKLSRYCIANNKPLLITGGFDAHLGCIGEIIIPFITPCADCYNSYFTEALKNWKPYSHPVKDRKKDFGGLASLSAFSASTGALQILKYFLYKNKKFKGERGELIFSDYNILKFEVSRNPNCQICNNNGN